MCEEGWHSAFDPTTKDELEWLDRVAKLLGIDDSDKQAHVAVESPEAMGQQGDQKVS